jgi:GGDEF domain-containing protein
MMSLDNFLSTQRIIGDELDSTRKELNDINDCLFVVVENMSCGVSVINKDHRLVLCNKKFVEMYGLSQPLQRPGTSLSSIIEFAQSIPSEEDSERVVAWEMDWINREIASVRRGAPPQRHRRALSNGRTIQVTFHPLNAGGWVDVHEDITDGGHQYLEQDWASSLDPSSRMLTKSKFYTDVNNALTNITEKKGGALYLVEISARRFVRRTFGLSMGDQLVAEVGKTLVNFVRPNDLVAQLDGDLLSVFLVEIPHRQDLSGFASRLHTALRVERKIAGRTLDAGIRMGGAVAPLDGHDSETLINAALSRISV